jgi:hypothetical protein
LLQGVGELCRSASTSSKFTPSELLEIPLPSFRVRGCFSSIDRRFFGGIFAKPDRKPDWGKSSPAKEEIKERIGSYDPAEIKG